MTPLLNPERAWDPPASTRALDRAEIERRVGPLAGEPTALSGGLANLNVRIDEGRVLRIYRRDPRARALEAALLARRWSSLVVPSVLASGDDFLVLAYVPHAPLEDSAEHGAAVGRALAGIHATRFERAGLLGPDLAVREPFADGFHALRDYAAACLRSRAAEPDLADAVRRLGDAHEAELRRATPSPVLLHADFKVSNVFWTDAGRPLVLDWEFAWAGPALLDVGQLFRWLPSDAFEAGFAPSYRENGGALPRDWRRLAEICDLWNLAGLLEKSEPGSRRAADVTARMRSTLARNR